MEQLVDSLQNLLVAGWAVVVSLLGLVVPWAPLIAWVAFWLLAVNWEKLYPVLAKGGAIGVFLIGLMMILVWGLIAPPESGTHHLFGLEPTNFAGKTIYVTMLLVIMALCGSVQLSGACGKLVRFAEPDHDHSSGGHGSSSHGDDRHATHAVAAHSHPSSAHGH
ncbi:hypothetical protein [Schlesneria paludicola]|uniref:hypothetical protein n=1 Tax=Schlesneria paludicola TaxID=360056 RepID=UPI000299F389|nr:hypothetical protein [Schlesneria paludicola]